MKTSTVVRVADNSGPCYVRIIKVLRTSPLGIAKIGHHMVASVLYVHDRPKFKVVKGSLVRAMCIRMADTLQRKEDHRLRFQYPAVAIVTRAGLPKGTTLFGPIPKELREKGYIRLVSLSTIAL
jgi:large subunit ribosomal protein L14